MSIRTFRWTAVLSFAVALGHVGWRAFGPPTFPEYVVGGSVTTLAGHDPTARHLYLRHTFHLTRRPSHSWLQVLSRHRFSVYINGHRIASRNGNGVPAGMLTAISEYLHVGRNVIAIAAEQSLVGLPPTIAVRGAYLLDEREHPFGTDDEWRSATFFERRAEWWFSPDFDDRHWTAPRRADESLRARVNTPPRGVTTPSRAPWISPPEISLGSASLRREFRMDLRPRLAWLRLASNANYQLVINGVVIDQHDPMLGTRSPPPSVARLYDITPFVQRGNNTVALALSGPTASLHARVELEVEDRLGRRFWLQSDGQWRARAGRPDDWIATTQPNSDGWRPCYVQSSNFGLGAGSRLERVTTALPPATRLSRGLGEGLCIVVLAVVATWVCRRVSGFKLHARSGAVYTTIGDGAYLALLLPTLVLACGVWATFEPRVARQDVYRGVWVLCAALSVAFQWGVMALVTRRGSRRTTDAPDRPPSAKRTRRSLALLALLLVTGFWLRARDVTEEPLHHDEVRAYNQALGVLQRGFPSQQVHDDVPIQYVATSELVYYPMALAALVIDDDRLIVRFPAVLWGTATIALLFFVATRLFGAAAGFVAAGVYAFSPFCIEMSNFGRYFSQLQFFALLSTYLLWRTVRGGGPLDTRSLWMTTASFSAMYLSWEGSGLIAIGMALAVLIHRRGRLSTVFCNRSVWAAMTLVLVVVLAQYAHRGLQSSQRLYFGTGISDLALAGMWRYPNFQPWYYVKQSSWRPEALLPMIGIVAAALLSVRHGFRRRIRFFGAIFLVTAWLMALFLPVMTWRYCYHLVPFVILMNAAVVAVGLRSLVRTANHLDSAGRTLARGLATGVSVAFVLLGSGAIFRASELSSFRVAGYEPGALQFADMAAPARFVLEHLRPGDVILTSKPHLLDHYLEGRRSEYWPQSRLNLQAMLDDHRPEALDRRSGAVMLPNVRSLEALFARERRVWYILTPKAHDRYNVPTVSSFVRQHMEVVYEDFSSIVLFGGERHRTAEQRRRAERAIRETDADYLR